MRSLHTLIAVLMLAAATQMSTVPASAERSSSGLSPAATKAAEGGPGSGLSPAATKAAEGGPGSGLSPAATKAEDGGPGSGLSPAATKGAKVEGGKGSTMPEQPADTTNAEHRALSSTSFDRKRFDAEVTSRKDLPNFHEVHPFLYRSGEPSREGMLEVKAKGITTVIDLRAPSEAKFDEANLAKQMGIKYINLPMSSKAPTKKQIAVFLDTVKDAQQHPDKGAVLVHCAHGSDRTGCMVGVWRVTQEGWPYDKTYAEMRKYWFGPRFTNLSGAVRERVQERSSSPN